MPQPLFTAETLPQFIKIVKEQVPSIQINTKLTASYTVYETQNKNLFLKQLHSMFKFPDLNTFAEYPHNLKQSAKLHWICQHIKKSKEIWLAYNLLTHYYIVFKNKMLHPLQYNS